MIRIAPFAVLLLAACADAAPKHVTFDTLPGGVVEAKNTGASGWTDTSGWRIVRVAERRFGSDEPGGMDRPNFPAIGRDGRVWVVSQRPVFVQAYAADLAPGARFSRQGSGPGEMESPSALVVGDSLYGFDQNRSTLITWSLDGAFAHEDPVPCCIDGIGEPDPRGRLPLVGRFHGASPGVRWWSAAERRVVDSVRLPAPPPEGMWKSCSFVYPWQPSVGMAVGADGHVWWGVSGAHRFLRTLRGADTLRIASAEHPRVAVTAKEVDELLAPDGFIAKRCGAEAKRSDLPTTKPAWSYLEVDGEGNLWVRRPADGMRILDVYAPDGTARGMVTIPWGAGENVYWRGDRMLSVEDHEEGGFTLRVYRIERGAR